MSPLPYVQAGDPSRAVPRILHVVWVGSETPADVAAVWDSWEEVLPGWKVMRHTNGSNTWPMTSYLTRSIRDTMHPTMLADVIRIEAVLHYGGVYVDSDTAPGPRALENIEAELWSSFIASPGRPVQKEPVPNNIPWINNCLFGFPIQHPFLTWLWNNISSRLPLSDNPRPIGSPYLATGPSYYRMAYRRMPEEHRPRVLSMLSIPDINDKLWKTPPSLDKAIAVHYQQGSWYDWKERLEKP